MRCPYCHGDTSVENSRPSKKHSEVWRRRQCKACSSLWTTREYIDLSTSHRVRTSHNVLRAFSRDVLFTSIKDSLQHRKTALEDATSLTDTILTKVLAQKSALIETTTIIDISVETLTHFDPTAAAVYRSMQDE